MATNLKERIQNDMKDAMRKKETLRLSTIRMLIAAYKQREIDEQKPMEDADILKVINKMVKQRQDSYEQFTKAGRAELAEKEQTEIKILEDYLPEQLSDEEIKAAIQKAISDTGASDMKDMGKVMGVLKPVLEGRADMKNVSARIKALLNN